MPQKNPNRTTFSASKSIQKKEHKQTQNQDQNTSFPDCLAEVLITSCNLDVRPAACSCILLFRRYLLQPVCLYTQDGPEYAMRANTGGHVSMVTHQREVRMEAEVSGDIPLEIEKGAARITRSLPSSPPCYGSACVAMCLCMCLSIWVLAYVCMSIFLCICVRLKAPAWEKEVSGHGTSCVADVYRSYRGSSEVCPSWATHFTFSLPLF